MLRTLSIHDMLLIERLELEFQAGLNVLTGETGAGKSILLDSLGFVLGWRGRADLVRAGAKQGEVIASFDLFKDHPANAILAEAGLPTDDDTLILRRTNTSDGRKTAYVNDRRVSGEILRKLSDCLVELHGQHDDRGLLNPRGHRAMLDAFGAFDLSKIRAAWRVKAAIEKELANARIALEKAEIDREYLVHSLEELQKIAPEVGEEVELDAKRRLMQASEKIREDITKAAHAISSESAEGMISDALKWIDGVAENAEGQLDGASNSLSRTLNELGEAQRQIEECLNALSFNPVDLETAEERLFALRALARKHSILPDALPEFGIDLEQRLKSIELGSSHLSDLETRLKSAQTTYDKLAENLSVERHKAAEELEAAMAEELTPLKMERSEFISEVSVGTSGPDGLDDVTFMVSTNPGAPAGAINKIASGGELSRFLLALKVCLTRRAVGLTMIFDEIDRGVGGATADAVGLRLAHIAKKAQVLVVTHSPQVAAKGQHQWLVSKTVREGATYSNVEKLDIDARTDEIARMLSGDTITNEARAAALALLNN